MQTPDFAQMGPPPFDEADLRFLFEHFPLPGLDVNEAVRRTIAHPSTLESLLESDYILAALKDPSIHWLEVSPKLFFDILLRHALPGPRSPLQRQTIHYVAHLLGLFTRNERLYRIQDGDDRAFEYLVDLVAEAAEADPARGFLVHSHIGNYALFLAGLCRPWIEHRFAYKRRPVNLDYYRQMGSAYYFSASRHRLAEQLGLHHIFRHLAERFEDYRSGLERLPLGHLAH